MWDCCQVCFDARLFKRPYFEVDNSQEPPTDGPQLLIIDWCEKCIGKQLPCHKCMSMSHNWQQVVNANPRLDGKSSTAAWQKAYDEIFGDDLIGTTSIDLEDRFFSIDWQNLEEKPIEFR